jgi:hypothetical protein
LRGGGVTGSNEALNALAAVINAELADAVSAREARAGGRSAVMEREPG